MSEQRKSRDQASSSAKRHHYGGNSNRSNSRNRSRNNKRRSGKSNFYGRKNGNRRSFGKKIHHSKYISKAIENAPEPKKWLSKLTFADFNLISPLKENIASKGYERPTEIQEKTIHKVIEGRDVMGIARTGSGKTDAFLIPLVHTSLIEKNQKTLVIAPTRELAIQIAKELKDLTRGTRLQSVVTIGGQNINTQMRALRRRHDFVIGTPGRLKDLHDRRAINLREFNVVVLDEVDRMLDMGFVHEIKYLIAQLKPQKQTLFFSATMNRETETIAKSLLKNEEKIQIASPAPHVNIHQDIVKVSREDSKIDLLKNVLQEDAYGKIIIFGRTKRGCDKLTKKLYKSGFKADSIHGNKSQNARQRVLKKFRHDNINILVATDVVARGIDVQNVDLVVNYDEPESYDDYIHRIGRTGRAGKSGYALTFVNWNK